MRAPQLDKNGNLIFISRGPPPDLREGFERHPTNPYVLIPVYPECRYRQDATRTLPCGKKLPELICLKGQQAGPTVCKNCTLDKT